MNAKITISTARAALLGLALCLAATLFIGCATTKKVDWNRRIGNFSYQQAVAEMGPPDKSTALTDGRVVAEWTTRRGSGPTFSLGTGFYGSHTGVGVGQSFGGGERSLRLTFGPDGKLAEWKKLTR